MNWITRERPKIDRIASPLLIRKYGFTPVLNKTIIKSDNCSYFVAVPFPVRFGNDHPASFTVGFQFGIAF